MPNSSKLLLLSDPDNCFICKQTIEPGETFEIEGMSILAEKKIPVGFKIARRNIKAGEKIVKWQMSIGSATQAIQCGEMIHAHNIKSDYIPILLREEQETFFKIHA